jgi:hypothetical protein
LILINNYKDLVKLIEFFGFLHIKEVIVVVISHMVLHFKKLNIMDIVKTIFTHLLVGILLIKLATFFVAVTGTVGFGGRLVQLN